jgi:hypothetical protein
MKAQIRAKTRIRGRDWADLRRPDEKNACRGPHRACEWRCSNLLSSPLPPKLRHRTSISRATGAMQGFGFRFWIFTGPERNGRNSGISVLFGHPNLNFQAKFVQILNFQKKICKILQIQ